MTIKEKLDKAVQAETVVLHKFLLNITAVGKVVHAFFEGKTDDCIYGPAIRRNIDQEVRYLTYHCGNKQKVLRARTAISERVPRTQAAIYFVDKDLDEYLGLSQPTFQDVYVTEVYSIENYLVSLRMINQVWGEVFKLELDVQRVSKFEGAFEKARAVFYELMNTVMAWVVVQRRRGVKLNLDDVIELTALFSINDNLCLIKKGDDVFVIESLNSMVGQASDEALTRDVRALAEEFGKMEPKSIARGRFELWFFVEFARALRLWADKHGKKPKINVDLNVVNALEVLGPRVEPIRSLEQFLQKNLTPFYSGTQMALSEAG